MRFIEDINKNRDLIQACIQKYGWTSDHNLDWFSDYIIKEGGIPVFIGFDDGTGILTHKYDNEWRIWSDPLTLRSMATEKIYEFVREVLEGSQKIWCVDVSDGIRLSLETKKDLTVDLDYSLLWPILDMEKYNPGLTGKKFKEMRNAKNKYYREHEVKVSETQEIDKNKLNKIVEDWETRVTHKQEGGYVYDKPYRNAIENNFRGFKTARVMIADGRPVGINAGYEVPNHPGRFGGIIGIQDYSIEETSLMLWLEDLEWIKNAGYKELDMQGSEDGGGLKQKIRFGAVSERKTETFSISKK